MNNLQNTTPNFANITKDRPSKIVNLYGLALHQKSRIKPPRGEVLSYFFEFLAVKKCINLSFLSNIFFYIFFVFYICVKKVG